MQSLWGKLVRAGESLLGSPSLACAYCGGSAKRFAAKSLPLCGRCANHIPWIDTVACVHCGRADPCPDCVRRPRPLLTFSRSAVRYDERMKDWLAAYKYRGNERLRDLFAAMLHSAYRRHEKLYTGAGAVHCLTYVPVSGERMEERGFNQAAQLAKGLGEKTGIPVVPLLRRSRDTAKQSYKSRSERLGDLAGAFVAEESGVNRILKNASRRPINIVIIDDVYTTGSTLHHCAETIRERAEANVYGLTWAR
ncbi:ComF family protein [Paenibacillus sp. GYB003]|uniref:ComF family protein n=1 Tax=Paenibacillus sp. GYB003 TaxID=2994392 RepID=UPI002F965B52